MKKNIKIKINSIWLEILDRLNDISKLEYGWYYKDSQPPKKEAIKNAYIFLSNIDFSLYEAPRIDLAEDGEINLIWDNDFITVDWGVWESNYCFYAAFTGGFQFLEDSVPCTEPLPENVMEALRK